MVRMKLGSFTVLQHVKNREDMFQGLKPARRGLLGWLSIRGNKDRNDLSPRLESRECTAMLTSGSEYPEELRSGRFIVGPQAACSILLQCRSLEVTVCVCVTMDEGARKGRRGL